MRVDPIFHQNQPTNNDKMSVASRSTVLDLALLGLSVFVAILSFAKSYSRKLNPVGDPYFFLSYSDGFIKRGLVGHIFNTVVPGASPEVTREAALWSFTIASILVIALLMMWFWHVARGWIALFALFAASQFLPTLGYDTGYLDPYIYVLAIVASMALARDKVPDRCHRWVCGTVRAREFRLLVVAAHSSRSLAGRITAGSDIGTKHAHPRRANRLFRTLAGGSHFANQRRTTER